MQGVKRSQIACAQSVNLPTFFILYSPSDSWAIARCHKTSGTVYPMYSIFTHNRHDGHFLFMSLSLTSIARARSCTSFSYYERGLCLVPSDLFTQCPATGGSLAVDYIDSCNLHMLSWSAVKCVRSFRGGNAPIIWLPSALYASQLSLIESVFNLSKVLAKGSYWVTGAVSLDVSWANSCAFSSAVSLDGACSCSVDSSSGDGLTLTIVCRFESYTLPDW